MSVSTVGLPLDCTLMFLLCADGLGGRRPPLVVTHWWRWPLCYQLCSLRTVRTFGADDVRSGVSRRGRLTPP